LPDCPVIDDTDGKDEREGIDIEDSPGREGIFKPVEEGAETYALPSPTLPDALLPDAEGMPDFLLPRI